MMSALLARGSMASAVVRVSPVFAAAAPARGMATLKEVAGRIKSVKNIAKITKSMKMVAASKLRRATNTMMQAREYVGGIQNFFEQEAPAAESQAVAASGAGGRRKHVILAITTDRGLCGGVNSVIARNVRAMMKSEDANTDTEIFIVGEKGHAAMRRDLSGKFSQIFLELSKIPLTWATTSVIADRLISGGFDELTVVFNHFKNKIAYEVSRRDIRSLKSFQESKLEAGTYEFDSDCLTDLYEFYVANALFHVIVENSTVELSSRTMAMDNATRNASQMIERLTLFYNRSRQAAITRELTEIISGASAV